MTVSSLGITADAGELWEVNDGLRNHTKHLAEFLNPFIRVGVRFAGTLVFGRAAR
jgi:hypothetical protein